MSPASQTPLHLGSDELRAAVRAVLRDVLPAELVHGAALGSAVPPEVVTIHSDADLDTFVRRVAALCEDPARRAALRDGRHGLRLAGGAPKPSGPGETTVPSGVVRVDSGAVTERTVAQAAAAGARLVVGPKAVFTPLARDKIRVLGVEIEREC